MQYRRDSRVGTTLFGQDETETRDAMIKCACFRVNPRKPRNPGMMAYEVNSKAIDELLSSGPLLVSRFEAGSFVSHELSFNDKKLFRVIAYSYLIGDL